MAVVLPFSVDKSDINLHGDGEIKQKKKSKLSEKMK